jgi:hypothetical protein
VRSLPIEDLTLRVGSLLLGHRQPGWIGFAPFQPQLLAEESPIHICLVEWPSSLTPRDVGPDLGMVLYGRYDHIESVALYEFG